MSPLESDIPPLLTKPRNRRGAVSGSVMSEEHATSYVKKVRQFSSCVCVYQCLKWF